MPKKVAKSEMPNDVVYQNAEKYLKLQAHIKELTKEAEEIKAKLKNHVEANGTVIPESGTYHLEVNSLKRPTIVLTNVCRTSIKPKADAVEIVKSKFKEHASELVETVEVFREDRLETLLENKDITPEEAEKLLTITKSYAFNCKEGK